ncbi:MAG: hypothetical protein HGB31_02705 [Erysipelotrichaceae bacterium]|nr:hypothetical protein [Erysipelotrichaceae bacterium]
MPFKLRNFTDRTRALVLQRAIDLVNNQSVLILDHDQDHAQCHVQNNRGGIYHVEIRFKDEDVVFTHCDCPYRGVGICKHTAAGLLQLLMKEGFETTSFRTDEFHFNDADVNEENEEDVVLKELIKEINDDKYFDLFQFLSSQDREQLLGFIGHYLEESEDIRLVVMAYLWYKSERVATTKDFLS